MRNLQVISASHKAISASDRLRLDLSEFGWMKLTDYLTDVLQVEGYVIVKTCNRIEIICDANGDMQSDIIEKWLSLAKLNESFSRSRFVAISGDKKVVSYLMELSAGLHSAIKGDDQIINQLKNSFETARQNGSLSTLLERTYQAVMHCHKRICKETEYRSHTVSLAYQSLKFAATHFGKRNLADKTILIIGAGDMAAQVVKYLSKFTFASRLITNRSVMKAVRLAKAPSIHVVDYHDNELERHVDIVISCTDQGYDWIMERVEPTMIIDLSASSSERENKKIEFVPLEKMQVLIDRQNEKSHHAVSDVRQIIADSAQSYLGWRERWYQYHLSQLLAEAVV